MEVRTMMKLSTKQLAMMDITIYREVDVSKLDGDTILYIIFSRVRGERFSEGLFGSYVADGTMDKWLLRLKELDAGNCD